MRVFKIAFICAVVISMIIIGYHKYKVVSVMNNTYIVQMHNVTQTDDKRFWKIVDSYPPVKIEGEKAALKEVSLEVSDWYFAEEQMGGTSYRVVTVTYPDGKIYLPGQNGYILDPETSYDAVRKANDAQH